MAIPKVPKAMKRSSPNLFGAHRYTIYDGMCALRGVLRTADCPWWAIGEATLPLRCKERTYPFVYFRPWEI